MRRKLSKCEKNQVMRRKNYSLRRFAHFHHIFLFVHIVNIFDRDIVFNHRFFSSNRIIERKMSNQSFNVFFDRDVLKISFDIQNVVSEIV